MNGKVALITASIQGLGKMTALQFAKKGYHLVLNYRKDSQKAQEFVCFLEKEHNIKAIAIQGDVSVFKDVEHIVNTALQEMGRIDIVINNAGPFIFEEKSLIDHSLEEWHEMMNGNLSSVFYFSKLVVPHMKKQGWGRMINIGFDGAQHASPWVTRGAYASAKVGLVSLTKTLALEVAPYGITVNMVCPGDIRGKMKESFIEEATHDEQMPVGRVGTGEDIARAILFLTDEQSSFITGTVVEVTGGQDVIHTYQDPVEGK